MSIVTDVYSAYLEKKYAAEIKEFKKYAFNELETIVAEIKDDILETALYGEVEDIKELRELHAHFENLVDVIDEDLLSTELCKCNMPLRIHEEYQKLKQKIVDGENQKKELKNEKNNTLEDDYLEFMKKLGENLESNFKNIKF